MLFIVVFTALYVIVFFADVLPLKKKKKEKEFVIVTILIFNNLCSSNTGCSGSKSPRAHPGRKNVGITLEEIGGQ